MRRAECAGRFLDSDDEARTLAERAASRRFWRQPSSRFVSPLPGLAFTIRQLGRRFFVVGWETVEGRSPPLGSRPDSEMRRERVLADRARRRRRDFERSPETS